MHRLAHGTKHSRIEFPGAFYHVMARGNRREPIFFDGDDRRFFLTAVGEACAKTGWRVHAWVLMGNHYHLLIETPAANLVGGMQWLQNTFTRRFNVRHRKWGRLFGDRYKAVLLEGGSGYYYQTLLDYREPLGTENPRISLYKRRAKGKSSDATLQSQPARRILRCSRAH